VHNPQNLFGGAEAEVEAAEAGELVAGAKAENNKIP